MATILDHIDDALRRKGMKDATASKLANGNASLVKNIRSGGGNVGFETLKRLADVLELECYFGPPRSSPALPAANENDFAHIPLVDARLAAGGGIENSDNQITDLLAFRRDWLKRLRVDPTNAVLARVTGNSMKPTLADGDTILIDTSTAARVVAVRSRPPARGNTPIYALRTSDGERVKRLLRPDAETFILLSDNPEEAPEVYSGSALRRLELNIIGQVVWSGHIWR